MNRLLNRAALPVKAGFVIFTSGSALCGLAPSVSYLIAFRVLQAIGAAMIMALGAAIVIEKPSPPCDTFHVVSLILAVALLLGIWAFFH